MYKEAVEYVLKISRFSKKNSLDNTKFILGILGNPQNKMKIIHVAGTNGKGSVCAYINNILLGQGKKVGLFTSPHLVKINERIKINNTDISDEQFNKCFETIISAINKLPENQYYHPSFFEFVFLMAMVAFDDAGVEYVVLETGLGGRLDATNVIEKPLATVITDIDLDHTDILGNTIEKIAYEKAGIIKKEIPVIYLDNKPEVSKIIKDVAEAKNAPAYNVENDMIKIKRNDDKGIDFYLSNSYYGSDCFTVTNPATYQAVNAALAVITAQVIGIEDSCSIRNSVRSTVWEGRMEQVCEGIYVDGAHNPVAVKKLCDTVREIKESRRTCLLFSVVSDKDYRQMIDIICDEECFDDIVIAPLDSARAVDMISLQSEFKAHDREVHVAKSIEDGFNLARNLSETDLVICAGSLYLVGSIKDLLRRNKDA